MLVHSPLVGPASLSLPAILAGVVVTPLGLESTFETFGSVVAAPALVVGFEAWRTRPLAVHTRCEIAAGASGA